MTDQHNSTEENTFNNLEEDINPPETDSESIDKEYAYYYDDEGRPKKIRDNLVGDHKVASSTVVFEEQLPDYLVDLIWKRIEQIDPEIWDNAEVGNDSIGGIRVNDVRKCDVTWLSEIDWISTVFSHYFHIANREVWEYDITEMEEIQVTRYYKNNFYGWHSDYGVSGDKNLTRKLSASILLTDPSTYSGGKLQLIDWVGKVVSPTKAKGSIIIFDSRTPHRVTPILKGERYSLVSWMCGPKLK